MFKYSEEELKQFELLKFNTNYLVNVNTGEITHSKRKCKISAITTNGYVKTTLSTTPYYNHRLVWSQVNGPIPVGYEIDHINKIRKDNRIENLRWATQSEQNANTDKRARKHNAKPLPEGLTQADLPKYVVYYHEWLNKEHTKYREYFKVEKHPKFDKIWITSKSEKVSIFEKLQQANKLVDDLENDIYPEKNEPILPKYFSLTNSRGKPHLVFEKRTDEGRLNLKMVLPEDYDMEEMLETFKGKVKDKYPNIEC